MGVSVEGFLPEDEATVSEAWDGVDCTLYYQGDAPKSDRIVIEQLKYSSADSQKAWSLSDFTRKTAKKTNNSIIRRLASAFEKASDLHPEMSERIKISFVSNRPIAPDLLQTLSQQPLNDNGAGPSGNLRRFDQLQSASGLKKDLFRRFVKAIDFNQTGSRFLIEESVLQLLGTWLDDDAFSVFGDLLSRISQKMMPEAANEVITRDTILSWLGFHSSAGLFPCVPQLKLIDKPVIRSVSKETVSTMVSGVQKLCIHGAAGCGKTTVLQEIQALLPSASTMIVFDCFGAGRYRESNGTRHKPEDAFLQLSNELAAQLRIPFLLKRNRGADYAKSFSDRLNRASTVVSSISEDALLVIAVDAADNSVTAAREAVPPERSFVDDFVTLGDLPKNVRLLVTARTGRLEELHLPAGFEKKELKGFAPPESKQNAERIWANCPALWLEEFHHFSDGNPRVQGYAIDYAEGNQERCLDYLRPTGKRLQEIFEKRLTETAVKWGTEESLRTFCGAIAVMPRPIPPSDLAIVSQLTEAQVRDLCADLGEAVRLSEDGIGFKDEDFEQFICERVEDDLPAVKKTIAEHLWNRRDQEEYAARYVVNALFAVDRTSDITHLLETEPEPRAIADPIVRQQVKIKRLQAGMQAAASRENTSEAIRAILVGAEALRTHDAITELVVSNPDLAVQFMRDSTETLVLQDADYLEHHGPFLFELMRVEARNHNKVMVRDYGRRLAAWLNRRTEDWDAKKKRNPKHPQDPWKISAREIAAQVESTLLAFGVEAAIQRLKSWNPRKVGLEVARLLVPRLLASGNHEYLRQCLELKLIRAPWTLAVIVPVALAGRNISISDLENALWRAAKHGLARPEQLAENWRDDLAAFWFDLLLTGCEIVIARGGKQDVVRELIKKLVEPALTHYGQIALSDSTKIVILLRARALRDRLDGIELNAESFLGLPQPSKEHEKTVRAHATSQPYDERREEALRFFRACVPFFDRRAAILVGNIHGQEANDLIREGLLHLSSGESSVGRSYDYVRILPLSASAIASLGNLIPLDREILFKDITEALFAKRGPLATGEEGFLSIFSLNQSSHSLILAWITKKATAISELRTVSTDKIEGLLPLARFLLPISPNDARAIFTTAHRITDEIDRTAVHQLKCLALLLKKAKQGMSANERHEQSEIYYSVITDAALRLADERGFPWQTVVSCFASFDLNSTFASLARWEDTGITDREECLASILLTALDEQSISEEQAAGLLPLLDRIDIDSIVRVLRNLARRPSLVKPRIIDAIARDIALTMTEREADRVADIFDQPELSRQPDGVWITKLHSQIQFLRSQGRSDRDAKITSPVQVADSQQSQSNISTEMIAQKCASVSGLEQIIQLGLTPGSGFSEFELLAHVREHVPLAQRVNHLRALCGLKRDTVHGYNLGKAILAALENWSNPAVLEWKQNELGKCISNRLPEMSLGIPFDRQAPIFSLLRSLPNPAQDVATVLVQGIATNVDRFDAPAVYALASEIVEALESSVAAAVLASYSKRLIARIPSPEVDRVEFTSVPAALPAVLARYLFALLSDCDVRIRWRAAHAIRRLALFGNAEIVNELLKLYSKKNEPVFRAPNAPFYWMSARLWLMIALSRVANEAPSALKGHMESLFAIATDQEFPHLLIRAFAKDAVIALSGHPSFVLSTRKRKLLDKANRSSLPDKIAKKFNGHQLHRNAQSSRDSSRFDFDPIDTIPYWYEPATRMFAGVSLAEFLRVAETWIVDRWQTPSNVRYWDSEPRRNRYKDRDWPLWSHSHGGTPTVERYSTYLEWNTMWCTIGTLLKSKPLVKSEPFEYYSFKSKLENNCLASPPYWLADLRCLKPLEKRFWFVPSKTSWIDEISDADFLLEVGLGGPKEEMLVISAYHETIGDDIATTTRVNSALVQPETAASLVRALQTVEEPLDYGLPDEESIVDLRIDRPPYRLISWISTISNSSGIDNGDPFRNEIGPVRLVPGSSIRRQLKQSLNGDSTTQWSKKIGKPSYLYEQWSDTANSKTTRMSDAVRSDGTRLWISKVALAEYLAKAGFDLIVEVEIRTRKDDGDYGRVHSKEAVERRYDRVILFRRDGSIQDARGRIGTWRLPRSRTRSSK
jgi:hypothetical protein